MNYPIAIIDYGVGNIASIANMFKRAGHLAVPTGDPDRIRAARKILLPGVGAFDHAAWKLRETGLRQFHPEKSHNTGLRLLSDFGTL